MLLLCVFSPSDWIIADTLSNVATAHNELYDVVGRLQAQQDSIQSQLHTVITILSGNTTPAAPTPVTTASANANTSGANSLTASIPAVKRLRTSSGTTSTLTQVTPDAPSASPSFTNAAESVSLLAAPVPAAVPRPMPAPPPAAVNPPALPFGDPTRVVTIGPLSWQRNITGQVIALMNMMPYGSTLDRQGLHGTRRGNNGIVEFPTRDAAIAFVNAWQAGPAPGYERITVHLN
jgi:hypothetical protein